MRVRAWLPLITLLFVMTACAGEGGEPPRTGDAPDGSVAAEPSAPASDGSTAGNVELPADLPVDLPEGGRVDGVYEPVEGTGQDAWVVRVLYAPETSDSLVEFYDSWFADEGIDVEATRGGSSARWVNRTDDFPLQWVTINFADAFYEGNNRLEVWYRPPE